MKIRFIIFAGIMAAAGWLVVDNYHVPASGKVILADGTGPIQTCRPGKPCDPLR